MYEATAALAALAVLTDRVRLGSLVFGITYRHPAVLANWAASVDQMSDGRLLLGIGAGWQINEHEHVRHRPRSPRRAHRPLRGGAARCSTPCCGRPSAPSAGEYYQVTDAVMEPKAAQDPLPILIGGNGDRMMHVVARHADEWNMWSLPDAFAERSAALDAACCEASTATRRRSPARRRRCSSSATTRPRSTRLIERVSPRPAVGGGVEQLAEAVQGWADVGVDELIVPDFTLGSGAQKLEAYDLIIEEVAPAFR